MTEAVDTASVIARPEPTIPSRYTVRPAVETVIRESSMIALRRKALLMRSATSLGIGSPLTVMSSVMSSTPFTFETACSAAWRWKW